MPARASLGSVLARPVPAAAATTVLLLPVLIAMVLPWTASAAPVPIDYGFFGPGGAAVLTGDWGGVYGDPAVQAGPFEMAPYGVAQLIGIAGGAAWTAAYAVLGASTAFVTALVLRPVLAPDLRSSLLAAGGTLVLALAGPVQTIWALGHPSEVLVPLVWLVAARLARRGRPVLAAGLVAASSGFEVWGVLGAPVVLLASEPRLLRSAAAGAGVLVALWLPFVLAGPFAMFSFRWPVEDGTLVRALLPHATGFPWSLRLLQALLALGAGTAVALLLRRRAGRWGVFAVPIAVVTGRLVLDPVGAGYYWDPVLVAAVGALLLAARHRDLAAAAVAAAMTVPASDIGAPGVRACALLAAVLLAAALAGRRGRAAAPRPASVVARA
ncbi:hypothetical protein [Amnibacterium kyonggiense]